LAELHAGRPRPVEIEVPPDILERVADVTLLEPEVPAGGSAPDLDLLEEAARLLGAAQRPLICSGGGVLSSGGWEALQELCDRRQLEHLARYVPALEALDASEAELARELKAKARQRERTKGMGELTDECLESELVDWERFSNRRQVGSYSGLCPREHSSGRRRRQGGVSKRGNAHVRTLMVEMAWRVKRYQPQYPPVARRAEIFESGNASQRKKAIVAVARRLLVDIWRVRSGKCRWEDLGLQPA